MLTTHDPKNYSAPWADQLPTGELSEYGPSPTTHARHLAEHKLWSWRPDKVPSKAARSPEADALRAYMRPDGQHLRADVPKRELEIYLLIFEHGRSPRWVAKHLEITRSTVRTYIRRLRGRAGP